MAKIKSRKAKNEYIAAIFDLGDSLLTVEDTAGLQSAIDDASSLRDEQQEKLDNMPDGLQAGPTGGLIQERINNLEEFVETLEGLQADIEDTDDLDDLNDEAASARMAELVEEARQAVFSLDGYEAVVTPSIVGAADSGFARRLLWEAGEVRIVPQAEHALPHSDNLDGHRAAPPEGEEVTSDETEDAPRTKLALVLNGELVTSRRTPTTEARDRVLLLVTKFGNGNVFSAEAAKEAGLDADAFKSARKRATSWFGPEAVVAAEGGWVVNLRLPEPEGDVFVGGDVDGSPL